MSKVIGMNCPHCGKRAQVQTSKEQSRTLREVYFQCTQLMCGHTWVASLEAMRTISPPSTMCQHPDVHLPLADRTQLERMRDEVKFQPPEQRTNFNRTEANDGSE